MPLFALVKLPNRHVSVQALGRLLSATSVAYKPFFVATVSTWPRHPYGEPTWR